ncbi:hypothetical protein [Sporosarcina sp. ZBG7A]|uniref:hypothetical protein n=1 Tax=Sporosarcina sp. ZBG7A TaxID=1582223 RepID=UPI00068AE877|nr:hypothetical protein [Sporosarcina sp. ZBG7A]
MNKKLKIFFILAAIIIIVGASYILYEFKFKTYDVADDQVDEIIEEPYQLDLPDGTSVEQHNQNDSNSSQSESGGNAVNGKGGSTETSGKVTVSKNLGATSTEKNPSATAGNNGVGQSNSSAGNSGKPQTDGNVSVASIKGKYKPTLESLENQAAGRLNSLIGRAKGEYAEKSKTGDVSYGYFYNKYMGAAKSMEAQTDGAFNSVMNALENELKANGYDKSYAKSFRTDYEARKKSLQTELMNKALGR